MSSVTRAVLAVLEDGLSVIATVPMLLVLLVTSPATAEVVTRVDRHGDAPASVDLLSVRYRNSPMVASQSVAIRDVTAKSNVYLIVGSSNQANLWAARV